MTGPGTPESATSATPLRRWPRWMGIALVASLALNVLVAGALATAAWRYLKFGPPVSSAGQATVFDFARTLPSERRHELLEATRAERTSIRPYRTEIRRARSELRTVLLATPFDADGFKLAQDRLLAAETRARTAAQGLVLALVAKMAPKERADFAHWQSRAERPWRRHRGGAVDATDDADPLPGGKLPASGSESPIPKQ